MTNKVWFHAGAPCNGCTGIGEMWRQLEAAGIPFGVYSVDGGGLVAVDGLKYTMAKTLIYRPSRYDYVPYHVEATAERAASYWAEIAAALPAEVRAAKDRVWIEVFNEPDRERPEVVARWQYQLAEAALADGYRFCGPGWAGGTPEPAAWRGEWMQSYLRLCAKWPERVAVTLHEYSYDAADIRAGYPYLVGRYRFLFEACDALGIARPTVLITETGWTLNDMPDAEQAMRDVATLAEEYAPHPQIRAAFLWSLIGGGDKRQLAADLNRLIAPVTAYSLAGGAPPVEPEPEPTPAPTPTPAPAAANLFPNPSFEDGWMDSAKWPTTTQDPLGWVALWNTGDGYDNAIAPGFPYLVGEAIHKGRQHVPVAEHADFFDGGNWTYKVFASYRAFWFRLKTQPALDLPAGRYRLAQRVFVDTYRWDKTAGRKDYNSLEPNHTQFMVRVGGRAVRDWTNLVAGQANRVITEFDHAGGPVEVVLHYRCNWPIDSNNLWLDGGELTAVVAEPAPEPAPNPEPTPEPTPTPTAAPLLLDLSKWNWPPIFTKMTTAGVGGLLVRASYGTTRDEKLDAFMALHRAAADAPPVVGFYHYFHPWQDWRAQLDTLLAAMRQHGVGRGVLDLEDMRFVAPSAAALEGIATAADDDSPPSARRRMNAAAMLGLGVDPTAAGDEALLLADGPAGGLEAVTTLQPGAIEGARQFLAGLAAEAPLPTGGRHAIYTNWSYWAGILGRPAWGADYDLWIAAWTTASAPAVPPPWATSGRSWTLWQYTSNGAGGAYGVGSARVDLNRFNGTAAEFAAWANVPAPPATTRANALWARGRAEPSLTWNPAFALAAAILGDGLHVISGEYDVVFQGETYRAQNAADDNGRRRVYYCHVPHWGTVSWIAGPSSAPSPAPAPAPTPAAQTVDPARAFRPIATTAAARGPFLVYRHDDGRTEDAQYLVDGQEVYLIKGGNYEHFRVADDGVYRFEDTSHGAATYYALRDDGNAGHRWLPRPLVIGQPFRRAPQVTFYRKADCQPYDGPRTHVTWALAAAVIPAATLGGHTVRNIIDLYVANTADVANGWFERYWYALGTESQDGRADVRGLVQWWARDTAGAVIAHSVLVDVPQGRQPLPLVRPACLS